MIYNIPIEIENSIIGKIELTDEIVQKYLNKFIDFNLVYKLGKSVIPIKFTIENVSSSAYSKQLKGGKNATN